MAITTSFDRITNHSLPTPSPADRPKTNFADCLEVALIDLVAATDVIAAHLEHDAPLKPAVTKGARLR